MFSPSRLSQPSPSSRASSLLASHRGFERLRSDASEASDDSSDASTPGLPTAPAGQGSLLRRFADAVGDIFHPHGSRCSRQQADADLFSLPDPTAATRRMPVADAPATHLSGSDHRRPANLAFQWFQELVDGIGRIDGPIPGSAGSPDAAALADALGLRLGRADLPMPPPLHAVGTATRVLLGPDWAEAVAAGRLNIADLLAVLRRSGQVEASAIAELRQRLKASFEVLVGRQAGTHPGVLHLLDEGASGLRPVLPPAWQADAPDLRATWGRMQVFSRRAEKMLATCDAQEVSTGALAKGWLHCLRRRPHESEGAEAALAGQVLPAVKALVAARHVEREFAARLYEAAARVDSYLAVRGALDRAPADTCVVLAGIDPMGPAEARERLFGPMMRAALDPEELEARLQQADSGALLGFMVPALATDPACAEKIMQLLRQTLRPMQDAGLLTQHEHQRVLKRVNSALRLREARTVRSETI